VYNKLVFEPSGNSWGQNMGGYINCPSSNVNDCPFQVQLTQEVNVYKEAESIQRTVPQEQAF
ncbi:MAG TPA: T4SS-associated protein EirA, partial [Coxiellaceae bacterium]|nr:T4SS-associated protein EirA [Coxiellaceae bacterium]